MNNEHCDGGDMPERDASGPMEQGGRYYILLWTTGWSGRIAKFLYDFVDAREAVAFVRYHLLPGVITSQPDAVTPADIRLRALWFFLHDSRGLDAFELLVEWSEAIHFTDAPPLDAEVDSVMEAFNTAFACASETDDEHPPTRHRILGYGPLARVLGACGLVEELYERHEEDPDEPYEYGQLAALLANGEFDKREAEHLDLAREYFDDQRVLARKDVS